MFTDARVIWGAIGLTAFVIGMLQLLVPLIQRRDQAMLLWGVGNLVGATGATLISLRTELPDPLSIALGNALLIGARTVFWAGLRSFNGQPIRWLFVVTPTAAIGIAFLTLPVFIDDTSARVAATGVVYMVFTIWTIADGIRAERHEHLLWRRAIIVVMAGWTVLALGRSVLGVIAPDRIDPSTASGTDVITPILGLVLCLTNGFCTILLTRERLELELIAAAHRDFPTGTLNRAGLYERSAELLERSGAWPVTVLLMDLDEFKTVNDRFGHLAGDRVISDFARIAGQQVAPDGLLGRFGGEEFCAVLPNTDVAGAREVAERIREGFERHTLTFDELAIKATVSIGVAPVRSTATGLDGALAEADQALYAAKAVGRNRVVAGPQEESVS